MIVTYYRAIASVCKVTARKSYAIETRRGFLDWQYNQSVGNETGLANFNRWAAKQPGWIYVAPASES